MNRLTIRNSDGTVSQPTHSTFEKVFNRLSEYEDTGLEPDEILTCKELAEAAYAFILLKEYKSLGTIDHIRELLKAEQDGRLLVLPCKIGDTVYDISEFVEGIPYPEMYEFHTDYIGIRKSDDGKTVISLDFMDYYMDDFGRIVFTSREEAEKALED